MEWYKILIIVLDVLFIVFALFVNEKTRNTRLIKEQIHCFYNDKEKDKKKIYWVDIVFFYLIPLFVGFSLAFTFKYYFDEQISNVLITIFSILFTILFGAMSIIATRSKSNNEVLNRVVKETFITISKTILVSIFIIIFLVLEIVLIGKVNEYALISFTAILISSSIHCVELILMTVKRCVAIYLDGSNND